MVSAPVISTPYLLLDLNSQNAVTGSQAAHTLLPCSRVLLASLAIPEAAGGDNEGLVPLSHACAQRHMCVCRSVNGCRAVCVSLCGCSFPRCR